MKRILICSVPKAWSKPFDKWFKEIPKSIRLGKYFVNFKFFEDTKQLKPDLKNAEESEFSYFV